MHFRFDKIDGFITVYDGIRYLALFESEKYAFIYNRIKYLTGVKKGIKYVFCHNYAKVKVDSYDSLLLEKTMTFHNVIILIKLVFIKDKNNYYYIYMCIYIYIYIYIYYNIFLVKSSGKLLYKILRRLD